MYCTEYDRGKLLQCVSYASITFFSVLNFDWPMKINFQKMCEARFWRKICRDLPRIAGEDRSHVRAKLSENYRAVFYSPFYDPTFDKLLWFSGDIGKNKTMFFVLCYCVHLKKLSCRFETTIYLPLFSQYTFKMWYSEKNNVHIEGSKFF